MQEFQQKFWAWATNTGVFAEPFLSLDVRLGGHEQPVSMIVSLLKLLKVNLEAVLRLDRAFCPSPVQCQQEEPEMLDTLLGDKDKELVSSNTIKHLEGPLYGVDGCIQRLFRIANHISQSSQKSLQGRMDSFAQRHENNFAGFEHLMGIIVEFKFPGMQTSFQAQLDRVPKEHQAVEAQSTPFPPQQTQTHKPPPSESLRPSTFDGDLFKKELYGRPESQSDMESTISAWTGDVEYPRAPVPSEMLAGAPGLLECPYCLRLHSSTDYKNARWWSRLRNHVNQDLKPYICISEDCASFQPPIRFAKSRKWREHMEKTHGNDWDQHIHKNLSSETERPAKTCPMCDTAVNLFPTTDTGHNNNTVDYHPPTKPLGRDRRVRFNDYEDMNGEIHLPPDTDKHTQPPNYEAMDPDKIKLIKHIAQHLLSWCFLSLRNGIDDTDLGIEANKSNASVNPDRLDQANSGIGSMMENLSLNFEENRPFDLEPAVDDHSSLSGNDRNEWESLLAEKPYDAKKDPIIQHFAARRERPALREATMQQLKRQRLRLAKLFRHAEITVSDHRLETRYTWIPLSSIHRIIENDGIRNALQEESESVKGFVLLKAKRLISALIRRDHLDWLQLFYNADFGDEHFPINFRIDRDSQVWTLQSCESHKSISFKVSEEEVNGISKYDGDSLADFCDYHQWQYFVPVFAPNEPAHFFDPRCPMPFVKQFEPYATNFSIARHFVIHRSHLNFPRDDQIGTIVDAEDNPHVAVKELLSAQGLTAEMFQDLAKNETTILTRLRDQKHPHFIRAIASYTQGNRHFFVFPWARGGNLRNFWKFQPSLSAASEETSTQDWNTYLEWFFEQLLGLASAIRNLHHPRDDPNESCRHGDLKPENILCFSKNEDDIGEGRIPTGVRLVVADAGHAKVHEMATEYRGSPTATPKGTVMYSPPEADTQEARSRRYDVWSLGCLYLESLIWMMYGYEGVQKFHQNVGPGEPYFVKDASVDLKDAVKGWIKEIKQDSRCAPVERTAVGRLVSLIEERMLVVRVTTRDPDTQQSTGLEVIVRARTLPPDSAAPVKEKPGRADSIEVHEEMENIFDAGKQKTDVTWMIRDAEAGARGPPTITRGFAPIDRIRPATYGSPEYRT
ncbi:protein kinase domain-containing protein [Colletotrichum paranaense]|uniref:Protein kinase domain-containing protein n=1 Tax=Colletotrichum paranaense TaxID=1914294 RepID=A0ABQ9T7G1_9PEZI|nr:protein kinase domain-containing protein [Colletotrichum paranaense]KAK1547678.1 protein kinase domain-containing protein [Colletotrichum paranaense]